MALARTMRNVHRLFLLFGSQKEEVSGRELARLRCSGLVGTTLLG